MIDALTNFWSYIQTSIMAEPVSPYGLKRLGSPKIARTRWSPLIRPILQVIRFNRGCSNHTNSGWGRQTHPSRTTIVGAEDRATQSARPTGSRSGAPRGTRQLSSLTKGRWLWSSVSCFGWLLLQRLSPCCYPVQYRRGDIHVVNDLLVAQVKVSPPHQQRS